MKPINAEEIVRVFNGWLEEADSLAEREAIECCIDHIQDTPAVSQQELRSYMLPWFDPFAAPWSGKIQRAFPRAYVNMNKELILVPRSNTYVSISRCCTPDEFKAAIIENCSRLASKGYSKPLRKEHLEGINKLLDTNFTQEDMEYIYDHIEDLLNEDFSDTGKSEPNSYTMTFTLPEEVHEAMDKYIDENPAGKVELAQLLVNKAKGLI